jgi:hypothetical protein
MIPAGALSQQFPLLDIDGVALVSLLTFENQGVYNVNPLVRVN